MLKWLAAEDLRVEKSSSCNEKLAALEKALVSTTASLADVERARAEVLKYTSQLPEPMAGMYYARVVILKRSKGSRHRRFIGAAIAGGVVVICLVSLLVRSSMRAGAARQVADTADQMIRQGRLPQARELLEQNPEIATTARYLAVRQALMEAEKKEQLRVDAFRAAIDQAQASNTRAEADIALKEADRLAFTNAERLQVDNMTTIWNFKGREVVENQEDRFQQQIGDANDVLDRLENLRLKGPPDSAFLKLAKTAELLEKFTVTLKQLSMRVKPGLARHVDAAESRLARIQIDVAHVLKRAELIDRLTHASLIAATQVDSDNQVRQFTTALRQFADAFPSDPKAKDFTDIAPEGELWRSVVAWQDLRSRWQPALPSSLAGIKVRIRECETWLGDYAAFCPSRR